MTDTVYIHYGHTEFKPELIKPLDYKDSKSAIGITVKPPYCSGLWGSPINAENSWKHWNQCSEYLECDDENSFRFKIKDGYKILMVDSIRAAIQLVENYLVITTFTKYGVNVHPEQELYLAKCDCMEYLLRCDSPFLITPSGTALDFLRMQSDGYSGMEVSITGCPKLYYLLYGWDCDSIVVWNPNAVVQL